MPSIRVKDELQISENENYRHSLKVDSKMTKTQLSDNSRILWIDFAKLIGIFLVILGHLGLRNILIRNFIYSFHMPLFFFLSGITTKKENLAKIVKKNFQCLIIPYFAFYLITYVWWFFYYFIRNPGLFERNITVAFIKPMLGMLYGIGWDTPFSTMLNVPLWFLLALFFCKLFYGVTNLCPKKVFVFVNIFLCVVFTVTVIMFRKSIRKFPFSIGPVFLVYPFFLSGAFLNKIKHVFEKFKSMHLLYRIGILLLSTLITSFLSIKNGSVDINTVFPGSSIILFFINSFTGILMIIAFVNIFPYPKMFDVFSKNTLIILAFHWIVSCGIFSIIRFIKKDFVAINLNLPTALIISFVTLLLCYIPIFIITKKMPFIIGKKKVQKVHCKKNNKSTVCYLILF
ncbi:MAG: acyltransferase family protein [Treponemataceae bacterium]